MEERERQRREALLGRTSDLPTKPAEPVSGARPSEPVPAPAAAAAAAAAAPAPGKYVPRFKRSGESAAPHPPEPERTDRWGRPDDRPPPSNDRWGRSDGRPDDRRPAFGGGSRLSSSSSTWSSRRG